MNGDVSLHTLAARVTALEGSDTPTGDAPDLSSLVHALAERVEALEVTSHDSTALVERVGRLEGANVTPSDMESLLARVDRLESQSTDKPTADEGTVTEVPTEATAPRKRGKTNG